MFFVPRRAKQYIKNVKFSINTVEKECLTPEMKEVHEIVEMILDINDENFQDIYKVVESHPQHINKVERLIEKAFLIRPLKIKLLTELLVKIVKKFGYMDHPSEPIIRMILFACGVIPQYKPYNTDLDFEELQEDDSSEDILASTQSLDEICRIFPEGSIQSILKNDDINEFVNYSASPNFDPKETAETLPDSVLFYIKEKYEITFMEIMALFGSIKCFKFAMLNGSFSISDSINDYAIAGGNIEIIHLLQQGNYSFDNCFNTTIKYHRNNIGDWLLNNSKCEYVDFCNVLHYYNIPGLMFCLKNKINLKKENQELILAHSIDSCNIECAKYLIKEYKLNPNKVNSVGAIKLHYVCADGNFEAAKFLIEECHSNPNAFDSKKMTPLHYACRSNNVELVKYLVEQCHCDPKASCLIKLTPLSISSEMGYLEVMKYLIEECGVDPKTVDELAIFKANFRGETDVFKYLVKVCGVNPQKRYNGLSDHLSMAINRNRVGIVKFLIDECAVSPDLIYCKRGFDYNCKDTALIHACEKNKMEIVKYLIEEKHLDVNQEIKNQYGVIHSPLSTAIEYKNNELAKYLINEAHADTSKISKKK